MTVASEADRVSLAGAVNDLARVQDRRIDQVGLEKVTVAADDRVDAGLAREGDEIAVVGISGDGRSAGSSTRVAWRRTRSTNSAAARTPTRSAKVGRKSTRSSSLSSGG
jgi:hypothetical protein